VAVPVQVTKEPTPTGDIIEVDMATASLVWAFIVDTAALTNRSGIAETRQTSLH